MRVKILSYLLLVLVLIGIVQAFGISYEYMENKTLELYPGQNYMFKLTVQNKDEEEVTVNISLDSAIASLLGGPILDVPGKTYDKHVFFNITIPEDAQPGDIYNINYVVAPVGRGEGQVPIAVRYARNFKVKVIPKPKEAQEEQPVPTPRKPEIPVLVVILVIIIVVLILLILIWRKSQQISGRIIRAKPEQKKTKTQPARIQEHRPGRRTGIIYKHQEQPQEHLRHTEHNLRLVKQEKLLRPHQYFHLRDGRILKNLKDLYYSLKDMKEEIFTHHVNPIKNDFATWTAHSLEKQELANKLFRTTTKQEMLELIKNELEKR